MKKAVIFDFDGTIADSLQSIVSVFEELTKRPKKLTPAQINKLRALSLPELSLELKVPKWKMPILVLRGRRMLREHLHGIPVHAGMALVLEMLKEQDAKLYIVSSNSTENVKNYLEWHKLDKFFDGVYGGASLLGKARLLLKLIDRERLELNETWYVGDEMRDVSAARAVGLKIASVTWGFNDRGSLESKQPDAVVDTAEQLLKALKSSWKK